MTNFHLRALDYDAPSSEARSTTFIRGVPQGSVRNVTKADLEELYWLIHSLLDMEGRG